MTNMWWTLYLVCSVVVILHLGCSAFSDIQESLKINTKNNGNIDPFSFEVYPTRKENPKGYSEDTDMDMYFKDSNEDFDFEDDGFFSKDTFGKDTFGKGTFTKDSFSKSVEESRKRFMHDVSNIDQLFGDPLKSNMKDLLREDDTTKTTRDDASSKNINTTERTGVLEDDNERNVQQTTQTNMKSAEADELNVENPRINRFNSENPQIANIPLVSDINRDVGSNPVAKLVSLTDVDAKNVIENGVFHDSHTNEGLSGTEKREIEKDVFEGLNVVTEISVLETVNGETVQRKPSSEELKLVEDSILTTEKPQTTETESKLESPGTVNYHEGDESIQESSNVSKIKDPVPYTEKAPIDVIDDLSSILKVDPEFSDDGMDKMLSDDSDDVRDMDIILNNEYENEDFKRQKLNNNIMENITNINETPRDQGSNLNINNNNKALLSEGEKEDPRDYRKIYHTMHKNLSNVSDVKITFSETEGDFLDEDNDYVFDLTEKPNETQEINLQTTTKTIKQVESPESINNIQNSETSKEADISMDPIISIIPEILFKNDDIMEDENDMKNINFPASDTENLPDIVFKNEEIEVTTETYNQIIKNISDVITKITKDSVELLQETEILKKIVEQKPNINTTVIVPMTDISTDSIGLFPSNEENTENTPLNLDGLEQKDNIFGESDVGTESVFNNNYNIPLSNEETSSVTSNPDFVLGGLENIIDKIPNFIVPMESKEPYNNINTTDETPSVTNLTKDYLKESLTEQFKDFDDVTTDNLFVSSSTIKTIEKMDSIDRTVALIKHILQTSEIGFSDVDAGNYAQQKPRNNTSNTEKTYMDTDSTNLPITTSYSYEQSDTHTSREAYTIPFDTSTVKIHTTEKVIETTFDFKNLKETTTNLIVEEDDTVLNSTENTAIQDGTYIDSTESVLVSTGLVKQSNKDLNDLVVNDNLLDYQVEASSTESAKSEQNILTLSTVTKIPTSKPNIFINDSIPINNFTEFKSKNISVKGENTIPNTASKKTVVPSQDISSSEVESLYNAQIEEYESMNENIEDFNEKIDSSEIKNNDDNKKDIADFNSENIKVNGVNMGSNNTFFKKVVEPSIDIYPSGSKTWWNAQKEEYDSLKGNSNDFVEKVSGLEKRPNLNIILNKNIEGLNSYASDKQESSTIVPILRGVILNNSAEFSVKITKKDESFYVPSYAYIREYPDLTYLDTNININITWKINDNHNNSLEIYVEEKENVYIIGRLSVHLLIGDKLLHRTNIQYFMRNTSDLTMDKNFTLVMDDGLRITFSNVDFLKKNYNAKLEYSLSDQRLGNLEVVFICLAVIAVLAIGFYVVIVKTKRKITLREKKELAQGTKC